MPRDFAQGDEIEFYPYGKFGNTMAILCVGSKRKEKDLGLRSAINALSMPPPKMSDENMIEASHLWVTGFDDCLKDYGNYKPEDNSDVDDGDDDDADADDDDADADDEKDDENDNEKDDGNPAINALNVFITQRNIPQYNYNWYEDQRLVYLTGAELKKLKQFDNKLALKDEYLKMFKC